MIRQLDVSQPDFDSELTDLLDFGQEDRSALAGTVRAIINDVRDRGDLSVVELTNRFDGRAVKSMTDLIVERSRLEQAFDTLDPLIAESLQFSAERIRKYHEEQLRAGSASWEFEDEMGNRLGQRLSPMSRVGLYAPGGKAAYPSTVLMTAIPAQVAGVEELILCVPMPKGEENKLLLAAAYLAGVDLVFSIGGAQAVAAMAYGTESVPKVNKIVGPGNVYVAMAKEMVFGDVGIDMIAGPSEVVIVADESVDVDCVIRDMFAQAEHDEMAQAITISPSTSLLTAIRARLPEMLMKEPRREIIERSIADRGALIQVADLTEAIAVANRIAPEHLHLALDDARDYLEQVTWAGAIFLGADTAEVVGDYSAGPSHVLPTSGTARFASPLGVYDFQVRSSVIECSTEGSVLLNRAAAIFADEEGLSAHAESARSRVKG